MLFCCTGPDAVHEGDYYDADTKFCLESVSITPDRKVLSRRFDDIRPSASDSYIVQSTPRFGQAVSSNSPRVCILSYVNQLKGCVKELNIAIYFFFRPSLNGVLFPMFCLLVGGECQILLF